MESLSRITATGAMKQIAVDAVPQTRLITDGAKCYPKMAASLGVRHYAIAHCQGKFNRHVCAVGRRPALEVNTGHVDNLWKQMKSAVPKTLKSSVGGDFNPLLKIHVFSWSYRYQMGEHLHDGLSDYLKSLQQ